MNEHEPIVIDDVSPTDVYIASLELRSVGTSVNIFPVVKYSHHFTSEPSEVPYSYRAIMQIAEKLGMLVVDEMEIEEGQDVNDVIRELDAAAKERGDDPIH